MATTQRRGTCRNPRCQDWLWDERIPLCASCRLMGEAGALAALVVSALVRLVWGLVG